MSKRRNRYPRRTNPSGWSSDESSSGCGLAVVSASVREKSYRYPTIIIRMVFIQLVTDHYILTATNGVKALKQAEKLPDLILLAINV